MAEAQKVPKWILVVSGLIALMEVGVSFSLCVAPASVLETVDLTAKGVDYLVYMWATRQFALGFIFAFATIRRSAPMLTLAYVFFLVMMVGDLFIGIQQKENALIIGSLVLSGVSAAMIWAVNRRK